MFRLPAMLMAAPSCTWTVPPRVRSPLTVSTPLLKNVPPPLIVRLLMVTALETCTPEVTIASSVVAGTTPPGQGESGAVEYQPPEPVAVMVAALPEMAQRKPERIASEHIFFIKWRDGTETVESIKKLDRETTTDCRRDYPVSDQRIVT